MRLGAFLSTLIPLIAATVVVWPTPSVSVFVPVDAFAVSTPAATFVESEKVESAEGTRPEPPSAPMQSIVTSTLDQPLGAESQLDVGFFLSTLLPPIGPATVLFPALSKTSLLPVLAFAVSVPAATVVTRLKLASPPAASPESPSDAVQPIETSDACQLESAEAQFTLGDVPSIFSEPVFAEPVLPLFPTASVASQAMLWVPSEETWNEPVRGFDPLCPTTVRFRRCRCT